METVEGETERVVSSFQQKARLPGFRPGKAPAGLVRKQFEGDIRQQVLENLVPKFLEQELEKQDLRIVGTPDISDVHFHRGEPLRFKAEFEVFPQIELKEYQNLEVPYKDPQVTDEDVAKRLEEIRDQKADYIAWCSIGPYRNVADGQSVTATVAFAVQRAQVGVHLPGLQRRRVEGAVVAALDAERNVQVEPQRLTGRDGLRRGSGLCWRLWGCQLWRFRCFGFS